VGKYNTLGPRTRMGEGMSLPCRNAVIDGLSGVRKNVWGIFQNFEDRLYAGVCEPSHRQVDPMDVIVGFDDGFGIAFGKY